MPRDSTREAAVRIEAPLGDRPLRALGRFPASALSVQARRTRLLEGPKEGCAGVEATTPAREGTPHLKVLGQLLVRDRPQPELPGVVIDVLVEGRVEHEHLASHLDSAEPRAVPPLEVVENLAEAVVGGGLIVIGHGHTLAARDRLSRRVASSRIAFALWELSGSP